MSKVTGAGHVKRCKTCRETFTAQRSHAKYCSAACRQKAARKRAGARPETARKRAARTKRQTRLDKVCVHCGKTFNATVAGAKRQYCTDACKLSAFRARRSVYDRQRAETIELLCILAMARGYSQAVETFIRPTFERLSLEDLQTALSRAIGQAGATVTHRPAPVQAAAIGVA